jgi:hypothetical protein
VEYLDEESLQNSFKFGLFQPVKASPVVLSAGTGIVQPFALFDASVVVAYTNDGCLRDAYK